MVCMGYSRAEQKEGQPTSSHEKAEGCRDVEKRWEGRGKECQMVGRRKERGKEGKQGSALVEVVFQEIKR